MTARPAKSKTSAWAICWPNGKLQVIWGGFSIYSTKREAMKDADEGCTVQRVIVVKARAKGK